MESILTSTVGPKGQLTLPKVVRELLGIRQPGELVGFMVDKKARKVSLAKLKVVPDTGEDFTNEEYRKLLDLPRKKGGKAFASMKVLIKNLEG